MKEEVIGVCIGEATPGEASFISRTVSRSGEYVTLDFDGRLILGMVEGLVRGSPSISGDILDPDVVEQILKFEGEGGQYIKGKVRLLGDVESLEIPKTPPPPGTKIMRADPSVLQRIFSGGTIRLGRLLSHPEVVVSVDANKMVSRHLAILAITGAGKSNTVSVIVEELIKLNGMPILFDMHSEYGEAGFSKVKRIKPRLNPIYLSFPEFKILVDVGKDAYIQERLLRKAFKAAKENIKGGGNFIPRILDELEAIAGSAEQMTGSEKNAIAGVINKVEDFENRYEGLVDPHAPHILSEFEQGAANVVDLGAVDEDYADVIVSHVLRKTLHMRRSGEMPPVFCIIEEAHILAPAKRQTHSKYWIDRIAREGRKFGVGLCLVSQRPKSLDQNSLSQANNTIIMRLVEPSDQRHVQQASERLSDDLLGQLNALNTGEAVVVGMMTRIPALVKIDRFKGKLRGSDPDITALWAERAAEKQRQHKQKKKEVKDLYEGMI
ncbi:MAG: ATP-binding protein [Methanobacteriota archaeon]|nr:MAG: ATP-binding protein [Euryarchaeota archaeon]